MSALEAIDVEVEHLAHHIVAAPVFDHTGRAVAAVGIVAPTARLPEPEVVALRVLRAAREISERLGWRPRRSAP